MLRKLTVETQWVQMGGARVQLSSRSLTAGAGCKISGSQKKKRGHVRGGCTAGAWSHDMSGQSSAVGPSVGGLSIKSSGPQPQLLICLSEDPCFSAAHQPDRLMPEAKFGPHRPIIRCPQSPNRENRIWRQNFEPPSSRKPKVGRFRPRIDKQSRWSVTLTKPVSISNCPKIRFSETFYHSIARV